MWNKGDDNKKEEGLNAQDSMPQKRMRLQCIPSGGAPAGREVMRLGRPRNPESEKLPAPKTFKNLVACRYPALSNNFLVSIRKWLFSPISALGSNFNPRNTSMYSCG